MRKLFECGTYPDYYDCLEERGNEVLQRFKLGLVLVRITEEPNIFVIEQTKQKLKRGLVYKSYKTNPGDNKFIREDISGIEKERKELIKEVTSELNKVISILNTEWKEIMG